jgi:DNA/RNA endonuclease YhcR with UshA esterase domain
MNSNKTFFLLCKSSSIFKLTLLFVFVTSFFSSCVKDDFDAPPADGEDPNIQANISIASLKQLYTVGSNNPVRIDSNYVIKGVVVSDDRAGNFYKSLVIQDSTGGINIRIDQTSLYTEYPVGRRVFIKCKGLWLGEYGALIQMGGTLDNSDPQNPGVGYIFSSVVGNYILKGKYNINVQPITLSINQLNSSFQNMLIKLENVEFGFSDVGQPFADVVNKYSVNRVVVDCNGSQILLRTSGYASFAGDSTNCSAGTLVAIYSEYRSDKQIYIRDLNDIQFNQNRCTSPCGVGLLSVLSVRGFHSGSDITIPAGVSVKGIVISDKANGNFDPKNMVIQDESGGIVIRFSTAHNFSLNDEVEVDLSGQKLTSYNGLIEVDLVPLTNATKTATGIITPRIATVAEIVANANLWESTLVKITGAQFSGASGKYSGTITLNDGTGVLNVYTRTGATFANTNFPTGSNLSVTGVVGDFNGVQLNIRSTADVQ